MSSEEVVSVKLAELISVIESEKIPSAMVSVTKNITLDTIGCALAAAKSSYAESLLSANHQGGSGNIPIWGFQDGTDMYSAALINGTSAHGEDFDSSFEGCPVHSGVVITPAILSLGHMTNASGKDIMRALSIGHEVMCRLGQITGTTVHQRGFHPTSVLGTLASTMACSALLHLRPKEMVNAIGIAASMCSGIIEYLSDGSSTKRLHAGWAAQSGIRASLLAQAGFTGPEKSIDGDHGVFFAFSNGTNQNYEILTEDFGHKWISINTAIKAYPSGTMTHPFIDCCLQASKEINLNEVDKIICDVGEGTVHRLWEPLKLKQNPPNEYAAKFSTPFCMALALHHNKLNLNSFSELYLSDKEIIRTANKIKYKINPNDPYPKEYIAKIFVQLSSGQIKEYSKHCLKGGRHEPLSKPEIIAKFQDNLSYSSLKLSNANKLIDQIYNLEELRNINQLNLSLR